MNIEILIDCRCKGKEDDKKRKTVLFVTKPLSTCLRKDARSSFGSPCPKKSRKVCLQRYPALVCDSKNLPGCASYVHCANACTNARPVCVRWSRRVSHSRCQQGAHVGHTFFGRVSLHFFFHTVLATYVLYSVGTHGTWCKKLKQK